MDLSAIFDIHCWFLSTLGLAFVQAPAVTSLWYYNFCCSGGLNAREITPT